MADAIDVEKEKTKKRARGRGRGRGIGKGRGRSGRGRGRSGRGRGRGRGRHRVKLAEVEVDGEGLPEAPEPSAPAAGPSVSPPAVPEAELDALVAAPSSPVGAPPTPSLVEKEPRDAKMHETPGILEKLCPPQGKITLNYKDHRFIGSFKKQATASLWGMRPYCQNTFGKSFDKMNQSDWYEKLGEVHGWLWEKWALAKMEKGFELKDKIEQKPGVIEDEAILKGLQEAVESMPAKTKYPRLAKPEA